MAITKAEIHFKCKVTDSPSLGIDEVTNPTVIYEIDTDVSQFVLTGTTTAPATTQWQDEATLTAGAATLDLTNLTHGNFSTAKDLTGLKVQVFKFIANANNTAKITVVDGASNGYLIFGSTSSNVDVFPGGVLMIYQKDGLADVSSTVKTIDLSSSDTDASYQVQIVAG